MGWRSRSDQGPIAQPPLPNVGVERHGGFTAEQQQWRGATELRRDPERWSGSLQEWWVYYGHLWTFMDIYGHLWTFMDICGHLWTFMDIYGHLWTWLWTFMDIYGHLWTFMDGNPPNMAILDDLRCVVILGCIRFDGLKIQRKDAQEHHWGHNAAPRPGATSCSMSSQHGSNKWWRMWSYRGPCDGEHTARQPLRPWFCMWLASCPTKLQRHRCQMEWRHELC